MAEPPEDVVDELYGAPLDEFTALRDARAKELRKADRAAADAIKKLRKPSVAAWAVNQLARQAADDVEALLAAGAALRQAQLGGGDRASIRESSRDEREAVERLVSSAQALLREAGRGGGDAALEDVRGTLRAAASDESVRELVRRGVLTEARQAVGLGLGEGGGFEAAFAAAAAAPPAPAKKTKAANAKKQKKAEEEEAARKQAAKERVKQARAALKDAEKQARAADRAVESAEADRDAARRALDQAEADLDRSRDQAEAAQAEADRLREELEAAEAEAG